MFNNNKCYERLNTKKNTYIYIADCDMVCDLADRSNSFLCMQFCPRSLPHSNTGGHVRRYRVSLKFIKLVLTKSYNDIFFLCKIKC